MPKFRSILFLSIIISVLVGISLTALYLLFTNSYTEFIGWFLNRIHKPHLLKATSPFLSQQQFLLLRVVAVLLSLAVLSLVLIAYKKKSALLNRTIFLLDHVEALFVGFTKNLLPTCKFKRGLFFFIIGFYLIRTILSIFYYPIDFDEADTYMLFSSQGPLVAATFYPAPNNHILFSIITSITSILPTDPVYALRLPLLPIGLLAILSMYSLQKRYFTEEAALLGLSFFIASYPLFMYSFLARGYLLLLFFYIIALYATLELCSSNSPKKRPFYLLIFSSVAGLYTIPIFLYALVGLFLFAFVALLLKKKNTTIILLVKTGLVIALISTILYLPVLISMNWLILKPSMAPVYERSNTLAAFTTTFAHLSKTFLSPVNLIALCFGCCFLIGCFFLLQSKRYLDKAIAFFFLLHFILPIIVFFVLRQQFPYKPWIHFSVATALLVAAIINLVLKKINLGPYLLLPAIVLFLSSGTITGYLYLNKSYVTGYNYVAKQCEQLLIEKNVKEVYTGIPYYKTMIDYYAIKNKLQVSLSNSRKSSRRYTPFDAQKKYDLIIVPTQKSKLPPLIYSYDTVIQANNTAVLLIRQ